METFSSKIRFVRQAFGEVEIARDKVNVATFCPSCGSGSNKKKKLSINLNTWNCHCWVCGVKGKDLGYILSKYVSAALSKEFRVRFLHEKVDKVVDEISEKISLPESFISLATNFKSKDPDIKSCFDYLLKRGIGHRDLWYFKIGTAASGKFRRRVIIPSFDLDGELNFFTARAIDDDVYRKYINSNVKKSTIIFNESNINWKKELTLVEGPFDLLKSGQNSTCLLGSILSKHSYLFKRIASNNTPVLLCLDSDAREKSFKIADLLASYSCDVRIMDLESFHDAGEMSKKDFETLQNKASKWTREDSIMEKISSIRTGSLF